jgi:hypothetical protein
VSLKDIVVIIEIKYVDVPEKEEKVEAKVNSGIGTETTKKDEKEKERLEAKINAGIAMALRQIHDKKYYEKYELDYKKILLAGSVFAGKGKAARVGFEKLKWE